MAILDTFYILFKADSKDAEKSFKGINAAVDKVDQSLNRFTRKWLSLYAVFKGLTSAVGYAFELNQASQALNVNIEELDAWGGAVQKTGGTVEGFTKSLESMAEHLGTSPKIALQLLSKVADQLKKMGQVQALRYGKLLGLDTPTILLLQQGRREVDTLVAKQKELWVVSKENSVIFKKFQDSTQNLGRGLQSLVRDYILAILPTITKIIDAFTKLSVYLRHHSGLIKGALQTIAAVLGIIAIETISISTPMAILIGLILGIGAAFSLAYDDIQIFYEGGDSLIGRALKRWPMLGEVMKGVFDVIKISGKVVLWFLEQMLDKVNTIIDAAKIISDWASPFIDKALEEFKFQGKDINFLGARQAIETASKNPLTSQIGAGIFNANNGNNKEVNITISEIQINTQATDPRDIAYGLGVELQKQLRQTQNDIAGGVLI